MIGGRPSASRAIKLGLLRIAPAGTAFPGRAGGVATPFIADVRGALGNVALRDLIVEGLGASLIDAFPQAEVVAGVAKAGVPWAVLVAERARIPAAVVNVDGPRASGLQRQIEGEIAGRRVVLVDNLISTGGSLRDAARVVAGTGGELIGALTVVADPGAPLDFPVRSLWFLRELIDAAFGVGRIDGETYRRLTNKENVA